MSACTISVIIPTLNAESRLGALLEALSSQTLVPCEVLVVDSQSEDGTVGIAESFRAQFPCLTVKSVPRDAFNHGATRHAAFLEASAPFVCFLTDDAIPANEYFLERLVAPFDDSSVALASGRQIPRRDARRFEQLVRQFNYGPVSFVRSQDDVARLGIKAFFASDACAAYRRSAYMAVGGFQKVETNEDMLIAAHFIASGYSVAYVAEAEVLHSHNFTAKQQYQRNKAVGRFLENHGDDFRGAKEMSEGVTMVKAISKQLVKEKRLGELVAFGVDCTARLLGNRIGRKEARRERAKSLRLEKD